jgi:hypothetical protein
MSSGGIRRLRRAILITCRPANAFRAGSVFGRIICPDIMERLLEPENQPAVAHYIDPHRIIIPVSDRSLSLPSLLSTRQRQLKKGVHVRSIFCFSKNSDTPSALLACSTFIPSFSTSNDRVSQPCSDPDEKSPSLPPPFLRTILDAAIEKAGIPIHRLKNPEDMVYL